MSIAKKTVRVSVVLSALAVTACGTSKKNSDQAPAPKISEAEAKAAGAKLPGVVIVKVPVDANGKEVNDKAEMRLVSSADQLTQENIATTFEAGQAPVAIGSELDNASSTESYCGWAWGGGRRYYGYAGWNWGFYRPTYLNYGYNYGYNYGGYYGVPGGYGSYGQQGGSGNNGYGNTGGYGTGNGYGNSNYYYYNNSFNGSGSAGGTSGGYSGQGYNPGQVYNNGVY